LIAATDTSLQLLLDLDVGNNGAPIQKFELQISTDAVNYYDATSYDGVSPHWTLDSLEDTLTTG
jgi:hypothetical protein